MEELQCPKCGSDLVIPDARLVEQDYGAAHTVQVGEYASPGSALFKWESRVDVRVQVCGACGFIELYATDPDALYEAHRRAQGMRGEEAKPQKDTP